jgi:hypothetical protein
MSFYMAVRFGCEPGAITRDSVIPGTSTRAEEIFVGENAGLGPGEIPLEFEWFSKACKRYQDDRHLKSVRCGSDGTHGRSS